MGVQNDKNKRIVLEQFSQIEFSKSDGGYILHDLLRDIKYSLQGTTQGRYLTGGVPPVRFSM